MSSAAVVLLAIMLGGTAHASPRCSATAEAQWIPADEMKRRIEGAGYRIAVFKTTAGRCYEIYGTDRDGRAVEIYFDPMSGDPVKRTAR